MVENIRFTPKVLIVSNQRTTGQLWAMSLEVQQRMLVALEPVPENVLVRWSAENPDLVIFDVTLPDKLLIDLIRRLRFETVVPILLLTTNHNEEFLVAAYEAGVDECILKPIGPSLFHAKVRVWLRRAASIPMGTLEPFKVGNIRLIPALRIAELQGGAQVRLTSLEFRLLFSLMNQPGRVVSNEWLLQHVWGFNEEADSTALKNVVYRLRQKIESNPASPKIIETVPNGYRFALPGA